MRRICISLALIAFGLRAAAAELPESLAGVRRIVTLGDSITEGGGQPGGYVWLLQKYLAKLYPQQGIEIVNAGISGHKSTDMQARFKRDVLDKKPELVTISVGVNDVWHGYYDFANRREIPDGNGPNGIPLPLYREKVEAMIKAAKEAGVRVAILSTTIIYEDLNSPPNQRLVAYNRALKEIAGKHGCLFIDLSRPFQQIIQAYQKHAGRTSNLLTTDGVHMNAAGNRVMAYTILRGLGVSERDLADIQISRE
jgi:lysophospholipase L1-like esterase